VIIGADSPAANARAHRGDVASARRAPSCCFTDDPDRGRMQRAIRAGVSSYVVALAPERLRPILDVRWRVFEADAELRAELDARAASCRPASASEKAKGILMQAPGVIRGELSRDAQDGDGSRVKLAQIAERIIDAKSMLS